MESQVSFAKNKAQRCDRTWLLEVNPSQNALVKLNVGGTIMMTKRTKLTRYAESRLSKMFSPRSDLWVESESQSETAPSEHQLNNCDDGSVFIDRNPKAFRMLLDFLAEPDILYTKRSVDK